jgi:hypothetical protein
MTTERIKVQERGPEIGYYFCGSIGSLIFVLQKFKKDGWEGIDYDYSYDIQKEYYVCRTRLETDEEYAKRMEIEENQKDYRLKQYEQLKKEFGNE